MAGAGCPRALTFALPLRRSYVRPLCVMAVLYVTEPLLSAVYIRKACEAGEKVQAALRLEAFRTLLMQRIEFFDKHRQVAGEQRWCAGARGRGEVRCAGHPRDCRQPP